MELDPTTVWMVHLSRGQADHDVKGTLTIDGDLLVFSDARDEASATFRFDAIRRAKRLRASPVLVIEGDWEGGRTAFYFSQPPPLKPPEPGTISLPGDPFANRRGSGAFGAFRRSGRRRHMKQNVRYLQTSGISKKELIQAWADEVTGRMSEGRN